MICTRLCFDHEIPRFARDDTWELPFFLLFLNEVLFCFFRFVASIDENIHLQLLEFYKEMEELEEQEIMDEELRQAKMREFLKDFHWSQAALALENMVGVGLTAQQKLFLQKAKDLDFWWQATKGNPALFAKILPLVNWLYEIREENVRKLQRVQILINDPNTPQEEREILQERVRIHQDYERLSDRELQSRILAPYFEDPEKILHVARVDLVREEFHGIRLDVEQKEPNKPPVLKTLSSIKRKAAANSYDDIQKLDNRMLRDKLALVHGNFVEHNPTTEIPEEQKIVDLIVSLTDQDRTKEQIDQQVNTIVKVLSKDEKYKSFVNCFKRWWKTEVLPSDIQAMQDRAPAYEPTPTEVVNETQSVQAREEELIPESKKEEETPIQPPPKQEQVVAARQNILPENEIKIFKNIASEAKNLAADHKDLDDEALHALEDIEKMAKELIVGSHSKPEALALANSIVDRYNALTDKYAHSVDLKKLYDEIKDSTIVDSELLNKPPARDYGV